MPDTHAIIRSFERFLSSHGGYYNNCTEVRQDTKGALMDEVRNDTSYRKNNQHVNLEDAMPIAHIKYDFKNQTEKIFKYKSRGRK
jgi:hypothetical protein